MTNADSMMLGKVLDNVQAGNCYGRWDVTTSECGKCVIMTLCRVVTKRREKMQESVSPEPAKPVIPNREVIDTVNDKIQQAAENKTIADQEAKIQPHQVNPITPAAEMVAMLTVKFGEPEVIKSTEGKNVLKHIFKDDGVTVAVVVVGQTGSIKFFNMKLKKVVTIEKPTCADIENTLRDQQLC